MITIVSKSSCPFCRGAVQFIDSLGLKYNEIEISHDPEMYQKYKDISGMRTVPQIFIWEIKKENLVGWYSEMMEKYQAREIFQ